MAELVIRGGTVIDGSGAPGVRADVAVTGGRIEEVGEGLRGEHELDASGQVVAPGFIDIHTHYDAQVFWDPDLTPSCFHGVTTVLAGNCGFSIAPCRPEHRDLIARTLEHVEDMPLETLRAGIAWEFATYPEYLAAVERRGTLLNFGGYVGHTPVRLWVMGEEAYERAATEDEVAEMRRVVAESVAGGAIGFSTSSSPTHAGDAGRPVPSRHADVAEMEALMSALAEVGKGVVEIVAGDKVTHPDVYALQPKVGRPITWTALLTIRGFSWHEQMVEMNDRARAEGAEVWPQVSCRPLTFQMTMAEPFTFQVVPAFSEILALSLEERKERYRDPEWRRRAQTELDEGRFLRPNWSAISVDETQRHPELVGRPIKEVARERGCAPLDVVLDVALDDDLRTRFRQVVANDDLEGIAWLLQREGVLLGLSDAGAHIGQLCDACMPTDFLGHWVRDREVLPLERAVRKLTGEPADVFGIRDRGYLRPGLAADITVFDPATVAPGELRRVADLPGGADRLTADRPTGITHVLVNGVPIRVDGEPVTPDPRPGQVVRSG